MANVNIDWNSLGFSYQPIAQRYVANFKDGKWGKGGLTDDANVVMNECAGILQYCQEVFEGLKAYKTKDGRTVTFRPDQNAKRMYDSAQRLEMPPVSEEMFLEAVDEVVRANKDYIPPFESGGALYLRPYLFATGPVIGVKPSDEYQFRLFGTPVGNYFKNGIKPITICVSDFDRAAPRGTGHIKAGLNYAMSLHAYITAHNRGYDENMFLDPATRTYVEETGGANFIFVTKDNTLVTPKSSSILPSITRRSLLTIAESLGYKVEQRPVKFDELDEFQEAGLCGTAAVICPVGRIDGKGRTINLPSGMDEMGPVLTKLYKTLRGIQLCEIEAPEAGWVHEVK
jgi:branched-chain amino acid aminotransferase